MLAGYTCKVEAVIRRITDYCVEVASLDPRVRYLWVTQNRDDGAFYHCAFVVDNRTVILMNYSTVSAHQPEATLQQILEAGM